MELPIAPGSIDAARTELRRVLLDGGAYDAAITGIDDPDVRDQ